MKTIKLKSNGVGRYEDVSPFIVADNKLELKVELPNFNGEFFIVAENNGRKEKLLLPRDGVVALEKLTAGELNVEVKHYLKGELIRMYKVEPLFIKEVDGSISALPEIEELNRRICAVERSFEEFKQSQTEREEELVTRLEQAEKNILALIRFAFKDNTENPYLNGGPLDKFTEEFELELTEEQVQILKGEKNNE